jgi:CBS domain containing-hemolysin-like protein
MVEEGHKEGAIHESEFELIKNVFELDSTPVSEVFTPLSQVLTLSNHTTVKEALTLFRNQRFSRIPILGQSRKEVIGILYAKDLLRCKIQPDFATSPVTSLMHKPYFVSPTTKLNALFRKFKQHKTHMAIVRSDADEILGVVTMSDVLDALFEDLFVDTEELELGDMPKSFNNAYPRKS